MNPSSNIGSEPATKIFLQPDSNKEQRQFHMKLLMKDRPKVQVLLSGFSLKMKYLCHACSCEFSKASDLKTHKYEMHAY